MNDDDEDYSSIYLLCSCRGVNAAKRGDKKTKCPFKVRLSKSEFGEFKSIVTNINHNHPGPFVTVHEGGQVELKIAQRYLLKEEEEEVFLESVFAKKQSRLMARFAKRYLLLFEKMGDDAAYEYFQTVSHIIIFYWL
jgi:hypothetical protein